MATNIVGVTMTQPLSDPNIQTGGSFTMGGQITVAGGGGWAESGDMYFEWDQGTGSWATIGTSGGLYHSATNPLLGLQTAVEQTITIYSDTADTYQVRVKLIEDDLTEYTTTAQTVTVSAPSNAEASAESCDHLHDGESPSLTQQHNLAVAEADHLHDGESPPLTQQHNLDLSETYHLHDGEQVNVTEGAAPIDLVVTEAHDEHYADGLLLIQAHNLSAAPADQLHVVVNVTLTQDHILAVAEVYSEQVADNIDLAGAASLELAEAFHDLISGQIDLGQSHNLDVGSCDHLQVVINVALLQLHALAVDDADHLQIADNISLAGMGSLEIQAADHLQLAEAAPLTQVHALGVDAGDHLHAADTVNLSGAYTLGNLDADHQQTAGVPTLNQTHILTAAEAAHLLMDDGPLSLAMGWGLSIAATTHLHAAASVSLDQAHLLTIQPDAIQLVCDHTRATPNATIGLIFLTDYRSFTTSYSLKSLSPHYDFNSLTRRSSMSGLVQGAIQ
jgi:hypothetical protein